MEMLGGSCQTGLHWSLLPPLVLCLALHILNWNFDVHVCCACAIIISKFLKLKLAASSRLEWQNHSQIVQQEGKGTRSWSRVRAAFACGCPCSAAVLLLGTTRFSRIDGAEARESGTRLLVDAIAATLPGASWQRCAVATPVG